MPEASAWLSRPDRKPVYEIRTRFAGPTHPRWKGGLAEFTCDGCGRTFEKQPTHRQGERKFHDQRCYGRWMSAHPEASNRRLRRDWSNLAELYAAGLSSKQLAEIYGCSQKGIPSALRDQGIQVRPQGGYRPKGGFFNANRARTKP